MSDVNNSSNEQQTNKTRALASKLNQEQAAHYKDSIAELCAQLPAEKLPQRDLYKGIEFAINAPQTTIASGKSIVYGLAASVCLVALVGYFSYQTGAENSGQQVIQQVVQQMSAQHAEQKQSLLASYAGTAEMTQNWQQQLSELDDAADAIKQALENDPNNIALLKMLKRVHEQQIALIERVHAPAWQQI